MNVEIIRLELLKNFWERKLSALEYWNDQFPLDLGPLRTTFLFKDIVRDQAEGYQQVLYQHYPN